MNMVKEIEGYFPFFQRGFPKQQENCESVVPIHVICEILEGTDYYLSMTESTEDMLPKTDRYTYR